MFTFSPLMTGKGLLPLIGFLSQLLRNIDTITLVYDHFKTLLQDNR